MLLTLVPAPRSCDDAADGRSEPVDLAVRRARVDAAVRAAAEAPVQHLSAALLEALQGSWGTPEELLGTSAAARRPVVAH